MTPAPTAAREHVTALLDPLGLPVHLYTPDVLTPPALVVEAGDVWFRANALTSSFVDLEVVVIVPNGNNAATLSNLEALTWQVRALVNPAATVNSPSSATIGGADVLTARIPVTIKVDD